MARLAQQVSELTRRDTTFRGLTVSTVESVVPEVCVQVLAEGGLDPQLAQYPVVPGHHPVDTPAVHGWL